MALQLAQPLALGQLVCVTETFSPAGVLAQVKMPGAAADPAQRPAAPAISVDPVTAGNASVLVNPIPPPAGYSATVKIYASCPPAAGAAELDDATIPDLVDGSGNKVVVLLAGPAKSKGTLCAVETLSGGPAPIPILARSNSVIVADAPLPPAVPPPAPVATAPAAAASAAPPVSLFTTEGLPAGGIQLDLSAPDKAGLGPLSYSKVEGLPTSLPGTVSVSSTGVVTGNFGPNQAGSKKYTINIEDTKTSVNYTATLPVTIQNPIKVTLAPGQNTVTVMTGAIGSIVAQLPAGATGTTGSTQDISPWGFAEKNAGGVYTFTTTSGAQASGANKSFNYEIDYTDAAKQDQKAYLIVDVEDSVSLPLVGLTASAGGKKKKPYDDLCQYQFNDCDWQYTLMGGAEESSLSAQDSETNALVSLFVRGPWNVRTGSVWSLVRFLGAANANNTNNVVAAFTTATGSSSSSGLPQVGTALDYAVGYEYDWFHPNSDNPGSGQFTLGAIVAFGATTPLSAQHATTAYVVPAWGTNECSQLISRFPSSAGSSSLPAQPSSPYITTTVTPTSGTATTTSAGPYCIINNRPVTTTSSAGTTLVSGTAQTDIAFAPEDRNSFLLKYAAGIRLITRFNAPGTAFCGTSSAPNVGVCSRGIVDFTFGQDQAITGGILRHFVAKSDVNFPIPKTSVYFFGSAAIRFTRNQNFSPLILQPATIVASSPTPPATIAVPSSTTWVLPLTQPNRDFYRLGLGLDLGSALTKIFKAAGQ